uniref:Lipoprotein n=1 Tax=Candidatus Kentrum sp. LFY TaxID=2126342 RepID=A0A450WMN9_9GAMM|nr:MAG: hypothetical protein BECKLFY1418C_GA0070996_104115 [Candidatus Kentron sp. LFY]
MNRLILIAACALSLTGCAHTLIPQTPAEKESGYTYIPVDPFPVPMYPDEVSCGLRAAKSDNEYQALLKKIEYRPLLESLPDNAVRMSIEQFDSSGNVSYGPAGIGAKGESYKVTVDYVNSDTTNFRVLIAKTAFNTISGEYDYVDLLNPIDEAKHDINSVNYDVKSAKNLFEKQDGTYYEYNIPVYVGIGLRVTANIDVLGATANISGLGVIGAEAEANSVKGSLIVQTLGINGKSIAAALPIQSELNRTTAQNAIVAVGSIKALLYDKKTAKAPRVVGIYLPFPGGKPLVNAIISEISKGNSISWIRPCVSEENNS